MSKHDFSQLFEKYPAVVAQMPDEFTSHAFILKIAQQNRTLYIEALFAYRDALHCKEPAPFMIVHGLLAQHLGTLPELVRRVGDVPSADIFGRPAECTLWRKYRATQYALPGLDPDLGNLLI